MRRVVGSTRRQRILEENNYSCVYCGDPAQEVDHIFPYSHTGCNLDENLVASCSICNRIASNKVFDGFIEKQTYIREEREREHHKKSIAEYRELCASAGLPIYKAKRTKEKQVVKVKKPKPKKKPPIPKTWDELSKPEPNRRYEIKPQGETLIDFAIAVSIKPKPGKPAPAFDYSNIEAYQTMFKAKYEHGWTYKEMAMQYGLTPRMARFIASGGYPGNKTRKRLNLPQI